jgi:phosphatidylserine/phosphatidylglycerophosphate/cardiolipin synthase-like enzyme
MIVDRERLLIGSQNLNHSSLPDDDKGNGTGGSRGVVLVTDAPEMVARAVEVFETDYDPDNHADITVWGPDNVLGYGSPPPGFMPNRGRDWVTYTVRFPETVVAQGSWFELVTAPESALRSSDALLGLVARAGAGDAIYVEQLYETKLWGAPSSAPNVRLQAYVDAARRGARVRILLNGGTFDIEYIPLIENRETADYVNAIAQDEGLDMSADLGDPTAYGIHNKMVLVDLGADGHYAHVGSINGSETANKVNREMALQVRSTPLFDYLHAMFEYDWNHRSP